MRRGLLVVGIGFATAAAHLGNNFTTYLLGGLIDRFHFTPLQMGAWSMVEMLSYAAAMFLIAPRVARVSPRRLALAAGCLVSLAQILSAGIGAYAPLVLLRVATGTGYGLANVALNLAAGRTGEPAKAISAGIAVQTFVYVLINLGLPLVGARFGVAGMFVALGALSAVFTGAVGALPGNPAERAERSRPGGAALGADGWRVLLAMAFLTFGSLAIWPFIERATHAIGISAVAYGRYQSVATVASMLGNIALAAAGRRARGPALLVLALLVCGCACGALTRVTGAGGFAAALIVYNASWFVTYPLLLGIAYSVDVSGRLAVMCSAVWLLMMSCGSLATGVIAQTFGGYGVVGPIGMVICWSAIVFVKLAGRANAKTAGQLHGPKY